MAAIMTKAGREKLKAAKASLKANALTNLAWFARALEDGQPLMKAASEPYSRTEDLARDLRVLLAITDDRK